MVYKYLHVAEINANTWNTSSACSEVFTIISSGDYLNIIKERLNVESAAPFVEDKTMADSTARQNISFCEQRLVALCSLEATFRPLEHGKIGRLYAPLASPARAVSRLSYAISYQGLCNLRRQYPRKRKHTHGRAPSVSLSVTKERFRPKGKSLNVPVT